MKLGLKKAQTSAERKGRKRKKQQMAAQKEEDGGGSTRAGIKGRGEETSTTKESSRATETLSSSAAIKSKKKNDTRISDSGTPVPTVLTFTSWWDEDREESSLGNGSSAGGGLRRRYVSLKFYTADGSFDVKMKGVSVNETVELRGIDSIVNRNGERFECWDLHIGTKINILGRKMTLMQADLATVNWLEHQAVKLRKIKTHLLDELRKFSTRALDNSLVYDQGKKHPGESCLRTIISQIQRLCAELHTYRPGIAQRNLELLEAGTF